MSAYPPPPPMRHSSAYHERQRSSNSSSPAQFYPPPPPLSRPPPAHVTREGSSHRERQGSSTHPKASISSATSGSSGISESKYPSDRRQNRHGSQAERGLMDKSPSRESGGPHRNNGTNESNFGRSEMVEDHSAVIRYIQHDDIDDEPPEKDHAIWILVSDTPQSLTTYTEPKAVLAVIPRSIPQRVQLYLYPLRTTWAHHLDTNTDISERRDFQYNTHPHYRPSLSKSPSDDLRSIGQEGTYLRLQPHGFDLYTPRGSHSQSGTDLLCMDRCRLLALCPHHGKPRWHRETR